MIQRIQSVFLFLIDIVLVVLLFVPYIYTRIPAFAEDGWTGITILDQTPLLVGQIALCILAAATLALYRKRKLQMTLCTVGVVLSLLFSGLMATPLLVGVDIIEYKAAPGLYISFANILLFLLARIFIKKDDDMVKSADRLR